MKIIKDVLGERKIKIGRTHYYLCCCINCKEVHAIYINNWWEVDDKIKCCKKPENWSVCNGADKIIDKFIEKWGLMK